MFYFKNKNKNKYYFSSLLPLPGAGTIKLDIASSLIELSVGGGGHTKLSIISTFRFAIAEMTGGSAIFFRKKYFSTYHQ